MTPEAQRPLMPGYGISPEPAGLLDWDWAEQQLRAAHNFWLATTGPDGAPHLAAVWAVWCDGRLCFSTGAASRKARNLAADPRCSLAPEGAAESLVLRGRAVRVPVADQPAVRSAYRDKYGDEPPEPLFAVRPETVIGLVETGGRFTTSATRWRFPL